MNFKGIITINSPSTKKSSFFGIATGGVIEADSIVIEYDIQADVDEMNLLFQLWDAIQRAKETQDEWRGDEGLPAPEDDTERQIAILKATIDAPVKSDGFVFTDHTPSPSTEHLDRPQSSIAYTDHYPKGIEFLKKVVMNSPNGPSVFRPDELLSHLDNANNSIVGRIIRSWMSRKWITRTFSDGEVRYYNITDACVIALFPDGIPT